MPTTIPDNIFFANGSTPMSAEDISAAEATSVQASLTGLIGEKRQIQTFVWDDDAARSGQSGAKPGDLGFQTNTTQKYERIGSTWIPVFWGGITPVIPQSVSGTNVSLDLLGKITFTNSSSVSINGCFTSGNYQVKFFAISNSSAVPFVRLRRNGADSASFNYDRQRFTAQNATVSGAQSIGQSEWDFGVAAFVGINLLTLDLVKPGETATTFGSFSNAATPSPMTTSAGFSNGTVVQRQSLNFDGITLLPSVGTLTGTARIYRYS